MTCGNNCEIKRNLRNCLNLLEFLFQWLVAIENKPIEKDGTKVGSNFAKFKIVPEYIEFIQPACDAEIHFGRKEYPQCAERCRNSMGEFIKYLYTKFGWEKPIGNIKPDEPSLDQLIKDSNVQNYLKENGSLRYTYSKKSGNDATHQPFYQTDIKDAFKSLNDLFYLITKSLPKDNRPFVGTQRFDISLLTNCPKELIKPQLSIEVNGKEQKIPQNNLLKAVFSKTITETLIKENLTNINNADLMGNTPLSLAVYNDDLNTVKMLLENGADPNYYFTKLNSHIEAHRCVPLIIAIKKDNVDIVECLLQYSARTWDSRFDDYYACVSIPPECSTVLACAFYYNAKKCIRFLLNNGIDEINKRTVSGVTPLLLAVENGLYVEKLLEKGAQINLLDNRRNSVFLHAVQNMRHDYELLEKLLDKAKKELSEVDFKNLLNHTGSAGCPISYMDKDEADLFLEYGADVNAKNEMGVSCIVDVAYLNPEYIPWFKSKGAKFDIKSFFSASSFLELKYAGSRGKYNKQFFTEVLNNAIQFELITLNDLNFSVSIDYIPRISNLVDAILFSKAKIIQINSEYEKEQREKEFLSDEQLKELIDKHPFIKELSSIGRKFTSYSHVEGNYNTLLELVNDGLTYSNLSTELTNKDVMNLPKQKLNIAIDMTIAEVFNAIASVKELSKAQRIALFEKYPFIKQLESRGIDINIPEEIESNYNYDTKSFGNWNDWEMSPTEIIEAIREIKDKVPYEDLKISPLDDALISKNYAAASIYLKKGIYVSDFTKVLLLSIHAISEEDISAWKKVLAVLKLRKDIDFSDVLLDLCKNHPKDDFDIAEEFIDNGYNFYRFANFNLPDFIGITLASGVSNCDYNSYLQLIKKEDGTYDKSSSIDDVRKRNNSSFLNNFDETSFQDVNLRLIKNAVLLGANPNKQDNMHKTAFDYAKENGIEETLFKEDDLSLKHQTGVICKLFPDRNDNTKIFNGQIDCNGEKFNFQRKLLNMKKQEVSYNDAFNGKTVTFQVIYQPEGDKPGVADKVTLIES